MEASDVGETEQKCRMPSSDGRRWPGRQLPWPGRGPRETSEANQFVHQRRGRGARGASRPSSLLAPSSAHNPLVMQNRRTFQETGRSLEPGLAERIVFFLKGSRTYNILANIHSKEKKMINPGVSSNQLLCICFFIHGKGSVQDGGQLQGISVESNTNKCY